MRDECFIRGDIPMTKSEVRAVSLSRLEIERDSIVYDIGAGTGSVSVEAALAAADGTVYAFEQKAEGCRLIHANRERFGIGNLTVVPGKAPESLAGCPVPDRVFVGGSGGNLEQILDAVFEKNPAVRVVLNVIALESLCRITEYFKKRGMEPDITCVQVSRARLRGGYHMMEGQNPVYIITADGNMTEKGLEKREDRADTAACGPEPEQKAIPRILLAAPASGSGKTVITIGLLALLKRRGISCVSFKCGPDYIDPIFHRYVLDIPGCNLDSFFLKKDEVCRLFLQKSEKKDMAVIEGVMGYYDGVAGNTVSASTYEIAGITDTPVILVLDGQKSSLSLAAQVKGFMEYKKDSRIAGVILNRTSPLMLERLRPGLEALGVVCLGAVPRCEEAEFESRHLGLSIPAEQQELEKRAQRLADKLEQCLDVDGICSLAAGARTFSLANADSDGAQTVADTEPVNAEPPQNRRRMAVARDRAFCFYYQENLDFLEKAGWELVPFSPLADEHLPERLDGILLGGGYPELYASQLSENHSMRKEIRRAFERGIKILAECGGFLYLHNSLEGADGGIYPMAGVIDGEGYRTDRLSRFGYITLTGAEGGYAGASGTAPECSIRGHEFHYWDSTAPGVSMRAQKPGSDRGWDCMYVTEHMAAGFPHLYYLSSPRWILRFLNGVPV